MTCIYVVYKRPISEKKISTQTESERIEKNIPNKDMWKKAGVAILTSDKIDFKTKVLKWDKEEHFIILQKIIHQEDITTKNTYAPNIGAPKYIREILEDSKKDIDSNTHSRVLQHPFVNHE